MTITDIIQELSISIAPDGHHHTTHGRVQIDCPWCSPSSHRWRLGIKSNGHKGFCSCWTCGSHRLAETLAEASGKPILTVLQLLRHYTKGIAEESKERPRKLVLPAGRGPLLKAHKDFLRERGFDPNELIRLWDISGIGIAPTLQWRVFIPIIHEGEVVSWTSRSTADKSSFPYISAAPNQESLYHKDLLYGEDYCRNTIVIQEGPLDVWALGPGSTATLGTGYTRAQIRRMARYPRRIVLFDAEPEAQKRADALCNELMVFPGDTINLYLDSGKDASRASKREIAAIRKEFLDA